MNKGSLFIISGPSGTGKGTICNELIKNDNIFLSISATTRNIRAGEVDGVTYLFVSKEEFNDMIEKGMLLEHKEYEGNFYGTPKQAVKDMLEKGKDVILEIEVKGALEVKKEIPEAVLIFIVPPSIEVLRKRLSSRGREGEKEIEDRIKTAKWELTQSDKYNYVLVNDDLEKCIQQTLDIIGEIKARKRMIEELINQI